MKTVKVKICLVLNEHGDYQATGYRSDGKYGDPDDLEATCKDMLVPNGHEHTVWVEVDAQMPDKKTTLKGVVTKVA